MPAIFIGSPSLFSLCCLSATAKRKIIFSHTCLCWTIPLSIPYPEPAWAPSAWLSFIVNALTTPYPTHSPFSLVMWLTSLPPPAPLLLWMHKWIYPLSVKMILPPIFLTEVWEEKKTWKQKSLFIECFISTLKGRRPSLIHHSSLYSYPLYIDEASNMYLLHEWICRV